MDHRVEDRVVFFCGLLYSFWSYMGSHLYLVCKNILSVFLIVCEWQYFKRQLNNRRDEVSISHILHHTHISLVSLGFCCWQFFWTFSPQLNRGKIKYPNPTFIVLKKTAAIFFCYFISRSLWHLTFLFFKISSMVNFYFLFLCLAEPLLLARGMVVLAREDVGGLTAWYKSKLVKRTGKSYGKSI